LTLELNGAGEWSRASETSKSGKSNVVPMRKQVPVSQPLVTQGNLLRVNSIKVNRQRPISPSVNESNFKAVGF
jgi:hypothetical protein